MLWTSTSAHFRVGHQSSGHLDPVQYRAYYFVGSRVGGLCLISQSYPVPQHIMGYGTHVLGDDIPPLLQECVSPRSECQINRRTRRTAECDEPLQIIEAIACRSTGGEDYIDDLLLDFLIYIYLADHLAGFHDFILGDDGLEVLPRAGDVLPHDEFFFLWFRIIDYHF